MDAPDHAAAVRASLILLPAVNHSDRQSHCHAAEHDRRKRKDGFHRFMLGDHFGGVKKKPGPDFVLTP